MIGEIFAAKFFGKLKWIPSIIFGIFALIISNIINRAVSIKILCLLAIIIAEWFMLKHIFKVKKPFLVILMAAIINLVLVAFFGALIIGLIAINLGGI